MRRAAGGGIAASEGDGMACDCDLLDAVLPVAPDPSAASRTPRTCVAGDVLLAADRHAIRWR